jgi:hypothetical protein
VVLISVINTTYICSYDNEFKTILNLTKSQAFNISGGLLKCGSLENNDTTLYFVGILNVDAYFVMSNIHIVFVGKMNSLIYVTGGSVCLEGVNVDKQLWVHPLLRVNVVSLSHVVVRLISMNVTNSIYRSESKNESAILFTSSNEYLLNVSISSTLFFNNSFIVSQVENSDCGGGAFRFIDYEFGNTDYELGNTGMIILFFFVITANHFVLIEFPSSVRSKLYFF